MEQICSTTNRINAYVPLLMVMWATSLKKTPGEWSKLLGPETHAGDLGMLLIPPLET